MTNEKLHRAFDCYRNQRPWMTLNGHYALYMRFRNQRKIWMKIDPYCQRRRCSPMTLVSGNITFMETLGSLERGVKRQWGCRKRQFSVTSLAIPTVTLEWGQHYYTLHTQSIVGFSVIQKCVTLNDLEWLFRVKLFSPRVWLPTMRLSKIIAWKLIKIDTLCQRRKSSEGTLVSGSIKFARIFARVL